jgi:glycosyltransferase involved in cell wall biosynthesis
MMRIGIDNVSTGLSTSRRTIGGMRHFLRDTVLWLERVAPHHEYVLFQPVWADPLNLDGDTRVQVFKCHGVPRQRPGRVFYEQMIYPQVIRQARADVFLGSNNILPLRLRVPSVVVMQSLQYFDFPQIYSRLNLAYLRTIVPWTLHKATRIIVLSETSKRTVIEKVRVPAERIHVVYHGLPSDMMCSREGANYEQGQRLVHDLVRGRPYILSVSSFYWQKNLPRLVESFARLKQRWSIPHLLLLIGSDGPKITRRALLDLASRFGVANSVICPGVVPYLLIPAFYLDASVTVLPSLYETFGLPVLEAMSCGCPVVTSQMGTMAEIAQDCALLVDPLSVESIGDGIAQVLENAELRDRLSECGRVRAQAFTLEAQARGYIQALEEAANVRYGRHAQV